MKPNNFQGPLEFNMNGHRKDQFENHANIFSSSQFLLKQWRLKREMNSKQDFVLGGQIIQSLEVEKDHIEESKVESKFQSELNQLKEALKNIFEQQHKLFSKAQQLQNRIKILEKQKQGIQIDRSQPKQKGEKSKKVEKGVKICSEKSKQLCKFQQQKSIKRQQVANMNLLQFKLQNLRQQVSKIQETIKKSLKQQSFLPKAQESKQIEVLSPDLEKKFQNIRLPQLPKPEELPLSSFLKIERSQMSLLNELKMCVEEQQKMKNLEINQVGEFEVKGKVEKTEDFKSSYEAILGVVILGGKHVIWTKSGLMKLKFASSELVSNFLKHVNKGAN